MPRWPTITMEHPDHGTAEIRESKVEVMKQAGWKLAKKSKASRSDKDGNE